MKSPQSTFFAGFVPTPARTAAFALAVFVIAVPTARAGEPEPPKIEVGRSALVVNQVVGKYGREEPAPVKLDDQVLFNEDISTGKAAKTIIRLRDGSTFALGPDAVAHIDSFVFNPDESVSQKTVTVTQGVFRYISGFAAKDQNTNIKVTTGTMSIRGSVVSGVVAAGAPPLLFVAEGNATFTNGAGSTDVTAGQGIAVPSAATQPINPASLPPAVIAQALALIEPLLPPPQVQSSLGQPSAQVLSRQGQLNLVPAATQQAQQAGGAGTVPAPRTATGTSTLARALTLLQRANAVGLLNGSQTTQTPQQQAFLAQVNQAANQALSQLNQVVNTANTAHETSATTATIAVAQGLSAAVTQPVGPVPTGRPGGIGTQATAPTSQPPTPGVNAPAPGSLAAAVATALGTGGNAGGVTPSTVPANAQGVQSAITSPGVNVTPTVISFSEANPTISEAALRTALNVLGAGTGAAAAMITSFAQDINNVADCDTDAGMQMAAALNAVLKDPGFSTLGTNNPAAVALAQSTADNMGVTNFTPTGLPTNAPTPTTPTTTATGAPTTTTVQANPPPPQPLPPPPPSQPPVTTTTFGTFGSGPPTSPAS